MPGLVESVPNFSEGRRLEVVDRLAAAVRSVDGVHLLDRTSDASHNRSVLTLAGEPDPLCDALERAVGVAVDEIDMERHAGEHPRTGAVDVVPFVPLAGTTMDEAVALARSFGRRIADRYGLPVFLYANAAMRAVAVGARPFLIAFNVNLDSDDVEFAKRVARRVRESGGGLPKVQANGFMIEELGRAQVSMNLLDVTVTPLWLAWETVRDVAAEDGVAVAESELIGLAPASALLDVADHIENPTGLPLDERLEAAGSYLRIRDFSPSIALERRLALFAPGHVP